MIIRMNVRKYVRKYVINKSIAKVRHITILTRGFVAYLMDWLYDLKILYCYSYSRF